MKPPPALDPESWARAASLVEQLFEVPADRREALLDQLLPADPEVREIARGLLRGDRESPSLLDRGLDGVAGLALDRADEAPEAAEANADLSGRRLGPYRLVRLVGRGGMGAVYLAERDDGQFRMQAALKLLPFGMHSADSRRRFLAERQLLAGLTHPNIARLLDGGIAGDGTPYFVMEYVEGRALDRHCDEERLGLRARLELFRSVCQAVQYAHQNLVVHRDLKPSNILVGRDGSVKLLDFGIAKLLSDDGDPAGRHTRSGVRVMTPRFAAPEQVRGGPVTTATDVYSLGVLLYELVTGIPPYQVGGGDPRRVEQAVLEDEPARPSHAIRRSARAPAEAAARSSSPERLCRDLEGDLDRIVLKAIEKEPARRYQSAQQLLDDLDRHQRGMPVHARPSTVSYRIRKYVLRHRAGLTAVAAGVILLASFTGFYTLRITGERDRAQAEAAKARATTRFLQQLLGDAYPSVARGDTFSMADLLARAVTRIDSLEPQPGIQAELLRTLGDIYREQGRFDEALPILERAVALHRRVGTLRTREGGDALSALGHLHYERKDHEAALRTHREELAVFETLMAPDDSLVLYAMNNVAAAASGLEDHEGALSLHQEVLARRRRWFADTSQLVHVTRNNLGHLYDEMGNLPAAERELREALRLRRATLPPDHPAIGLTLNNLGSLLGRMQRLDDAEALHREALGIWRRVYGPDHHRVGLSAYNLARVLERRGRLAEAESLYRVTLEIDRKAYGEQSLDAGLDLHRLGLVLRAQDNCAAAMPTLEAAERILVRNRIPLPDRRRIATRGALGTCLAASGRYADAEALLLPGLQAVDSVAGADSAATREALEGLVTLYESWGRPAEAERFRARLRVRP